MFKARCENKRFELECSVGVIKLYLFYIYLNIFVLYCIQFNEYVTRYCIYTLKIIANVIDCLLKLFVFQKNKNLKQKTKCNLQFVYKYGRKYCCVVDLY